MLVTKANAAFKNKNKKNVPYMPEFAANLTTQFTHVPFRERFAEAAKSGFRKVEFLFPYAFAPNDIDDRLRQNGLELVLFNLSAGDWNHGERGKACLPGREADFARSLDLALGYARALDTTKLHALSGIRPADVDEKALTQTYRDNISKAVKQARGFGIDILIEPINQQSMPGYFLADFGAALEHIAAMAEMGAAPKLQFDIFHCAMIHGDVVKWIERCAPYTAHYQIAGIPDRHEPDKGDLPLAEIIAAIDAFTPNATVGCEYYPKGKTEEGLGWMKPFV